MKKYQIPRHPVFRDFTIVSLNSGTYICPGWHPVAPGTTREQVEWVDSIPITSAKETLEIKKTSTPKLKTWQVKSTDGKNNYQITYFDRRWSCTCPANQFFKGDCKHIKKIKSENETIQLQESKKL